MAAPPFRVKALYDYSSKEEDDLSFFNGQVITVTDIEDDDWYFGEYADSAASKQEGLFPKNFVKIFEPETPPRPSRTSKSKKELELLPTAGDVGKNPGTERLEASSEGAETVPAQVQQVGGQEKQQEVPQQPSMQSTKSMSANALPPQIAATKPAAPTATKPAPPPNAEKPGSGSFRDRINAFNKSTTAPVAPMKPSGLASSSGTGFIKKPFVAPPPSKNAYVPPPREPPPQKIYRREEDPDVMAQRSREVEVEEQPSQSHVTPSAEEAEDQPKPTSLKDRIALLQKQQMEQAARHADTGQKKEKQKRAVKKQAEIDDHAADQGEEVEGEGLERMNSGDTTGKPSMDLSRDAPPSILRSNTRPHKSREATPVGSPIAAPSREILSDPNDADQSGVGDTEEGDDFSTGRDDSDEKPQRKTSISLPRPSQPPIREADIGDEEDNAEEEEAGEDDEDVDPEVKRRMEIRERMAKMSGGMGMAGMFGPPGGLPSRSTPKQASLSSDRKGSGNSVPAQTDTATTRVPPVPLMPMHSLQRIQTPEQSELQPEVSRELADVPKSIVHGRDPEEMPDVEDLKEEPMSLPRRSTERSVAPPLPPGDLTSLCSNKELSLLNLTDRPVPASSGQSRAPPPPLPTERPVPPPPSECMYCLLYYRAISS